MASFRFVYGNAWYAAILKMLIAKRDYCSACLCSLACLLLFGLLGSLLFVVYQPWRHVFLFPPAKFLPKNIINGIMYSISIPNNISPKRRSFRDMSQKTKHWRLRSVALQDSYSAPKVQGLLRSEIIMWVPVGFCFNDRMLKLEDLRVGVGFFELKQGHFNCFLLAAMF